ncbi:MAG: 2-C-methyl-D-erythritol 4-phosphate cytidylyltransferase [Bacillota bacterium]
MSKTTAIILSAGQGLRMGGNIPKQYLEVAGSPVIVRTTALFQACKLIEEIILVVDRNNMNFVKELMGKHPTNKLRAIVPGGQERSHSVSRGLKQVSGDSSLVVVHDGVRPFFTLELLERVIKEAGVKGAAIPGVPLKDTIKVCDQTGLVLATPAREKLWSIQTPQAFRKDWLLEAYRLVSEEGLVATDDAGLLEKLGKPVYVVMGEYENIKLTTSEDLLLGEAILRRRQKSCE